MFFVIHSFQGLDKYGLVLKQLSRDYIARHRPTVADRLLDNFMRAKYKISLHDACIKIINNAVINRNYASELIITIPDRTLNHLARLISYGTVAIPGSDILRQAFS